MAKFDAGMRELADRCEAVGWKVVRTNKAGWLIEHPDGKRHRPIAIPFRNSGENYKQTLSKLKRAGLDAAEEAANKEREEARQQRLRDDRASVAVVPEALNESNETRDEPVSVNEPADQDPSSTAEVGIPLAEIQKWVEEQFEIPLAISPGHFYSNILGLRMKPGTPVPCGKEKNGTLSRALCMGPRCNLTFTSMAIARRHFGAKHPTPEAIRRREMTARRKETAPYAEIARKVVGRFQVQMRARTKTGGENFYNRIVGLRMHDGSERYLCADSNRCTLTFTDQGLAVGHLQKKHPKSKQVAVEAPPALPKATSTPVRTLVPAERAVAAIAKVAAAPRPAPAPKAPAPAATLTPFAPTAEPPRPVAPAVAQAATAGNDADEDGIELWTFRERLDAMTEALGVVAHDRNQLTLELQRLRADRDEIEAKIRREVEPQYLERVRSLERQVLSAQERADSAIRAANERVAAAEQRAAQNEEAAAKFKTFEQTIGNIFAKP